MNGNGLRAPLVPKDRLIGVDIARGLAIVGGLALWLSGPQSELTRHASTWMSIVDHRLLVMFALLAGFSIGLMHGGPNPLTGPESAHIRTKIMIRAAAVFTIGHILSIFGVTIANTLSPFAFILILTLPFLRISARLLWIIAGGWIVLLPVVGTFWSWISAFSWFLGTERVGTLVFYGPAPWILLFPAALIGLGLAKCDVQRLQVRHALLAAATALLLLGGAVGVLSVSSITSLVNGADDRVILKDSVRDNQGEGSTINSSGKSVIPAPTGEKNMNLSGRYCVSYLGTFYMCHRDEAAAIHEQKITEQKLGDESQTGNSLGADTPNPGWRVAWESNGGWPGYGEIVSETVIALGAALLVVWLSLTAANRLGFIASLGTMPLTAYVLGGVATALVHPPLGGLQVLFAIVLAVVAAFVWRRYIGRGPVEAIVGAIGNAASRSGPASGPQPSSRERVIGLDIARGFALIGMAAVHMVMPLPFLTWSSETWSGIASGRSSILFAVLAGISMAIMSGREQIYTDEKLLQARSRILTRAFIIFGAGIVLGEFSHPIAVILDYYGIFFLLALPFLTLRPKVLFSFAAGLALVAPVVSILMGRLSIVDQSDDLYHYLFGGVYPAFGWLALMLFGIGLGRIRLRSTRIQLRILTVGLVMVLLAYGLGEIAERHNGYVENGTDIFRRMDEMQSQGIPLTSLVAGERLDTSSLLCLDYGMDVIGCMPAGKFADLSSQHQSMWYQLGTWAPHSGTPFEIVGSGGFAAVIIALCLLVSRTESFWHYPMAAVGTTALTVYAGHVLLITFWKDMPAGQYTSFLLMLVVAIPASMLWKRIFGRGPLERVLSWLAHKISELKPDRQ